MKLLSRCLLLHILLYAFTISYAQEINLNEVVVSANLANTGWRESGRTLTVIDKKEIESAPVQTLNELLEYVANIDVRQRGQIGVQADLSLRGSSFEQVLILLNGIKMNDPQTGHHNLNLPIDLMDIERIEIIYGGASRVFGPGAFAGAINIISRNPEQSSIRLSAQKGDYGYSQLGGAATLDFGKHSHSLSILQRESDGYIRNTDFDLENIFWQSEYQGENSDWFLNLGQNKKAFGAQNFYTARFPEQFEETEAQFISTGGKVNMSDVFIFNPRAYYRRHKDRFELFREGEGYYARIPGGGFANNRGDTVSWYTGHNYHSTSIYGAEFSLSTHTKYGVTSIGYDYRHEQIKSNVLGEPINNPQPVPNEALDAFYLREGKRTNQSIYLEHNYSYKALFFSVGILYNNNSDFGDDLLPGFDLSYQINDKYTAYASVNRSFRLPTYTDLYYNLGGAIGSAQLQPEYSINYELGIKFQNELARGHLAYFYRDGQNLIDWIRYNGSDTTRAANITEVKIGGVELDANMNLEKLFGSASFLKSFTTSYSYMYSDTSSTDFESNYVLDFLEHKLDVGLGLIFAGNIHFNWNLSYQKRRGNYTDVNGLTRSFEPILISDLRLAPRFKNVSLFLEVSNVFNMTYADIGSVQQPGRWFKLGIDLSISLEKSRE